MKLYELPARFAEVEAMLIDGEMTEEVCAKLSFLEETISAKVQACLCVVKNLEARAYARYTEAGRISELGDSDKRNADRLKAYVEKTLISIGIDKLETELFKVSFKLNPPKIVVKDDLDINDLPDEWVRIVPESKELDKKKIMAASKDCPLPFGIEVVQEKRMVVK